MRMAQTVKGRIKQINYKLRHWRSFFNSIPDFTEARKRRYIKESLLVERNKLRASLKAS